MLRRHLTSATRSRSRPSGCSRTRNITTASRRVSSRGHPAYAEPGLRQLRPWPVDRRFVQDAAGRERRCDQDPSRRLLVLQSGSFVASQSSLTMLSLSATSTRSFGARPRPLTRRSYGAAANRSDQIDYVQHVGDYSASLQCCLPADASAVLVARLPLPADATATSTPTGNTAMAPSWDASRSPIVSAPACKTTETGARQRAVASLTAQLCRLPDRPSAPGAASESGMAGRLGT